MTIRKSTLAACAALALVGAAVPATPSAADPVVPKSDAAPAPSASLQSLAGRWTGEGRLGFAEGKFENVKCRVTYLPGATPSELKQNIRCASASGNIEVLSELVQTGTAITGKWVETVRNMGGELQGQATPTGFRVEIKGADLNAAMDIIVRGPRQLVEIQFHGSTLLGLSLMLVKG